jgi:hypothetical protein
MKLLGIQIIMVTNAVGGINQSFKVIKIIVWLSKRKISFQAEILKTYAKFSYMKRTTYLKSKMLGYLLLCVALTKTSKSYPG